MTDCRLVIDPPAAGAWNMAVDEVLWDWSTRGGGCCLRLYRWVEPTLSLGYFQSYDQRRQHAASRSCAVVRRISGGGAIVHDAELTYSVAVPIGHPAAVRRQRLYEAVHGAIVELLADFGVEASIQPAVDSPKPAAEPFLCFQRRSPGDVLVGQVKVAGSARAEKPHRGASAREPSAGPLPGRTGASRPHRIAGQSFALEQVVAGWLPRLSEQLGMRWIEAALSLDERHRAAQLVAEKHATEAWVQSRGHPTADNRPAIVPRSS